MAGKKRGPNYPSMSLPVAIERARKLYEQDGRAQTSAEVAVEAWGYSSLNGASLRVLSALRQYGLLESTNDSVKLSDSALAILLEPEGSEDRNEAIRSAADRPGIFEILRAEYSDTLPSDGALIAYLVRRQGYNEKAAQKVVEVFRETSDFVEELDEDFERDAEPVAQRPESKMAESAVGEPIRVKPSIQPEGSVQQSWILAPDLVASVSFTRLPTVGEIGVLKAYLDIAGKVLTVKRDASEPGPGSEDLESGR